MAELIRDASIEDYKRGYIWSDKLGEFVCLICNEEIGSDENGASRHAVGHGSPIERLLSLEKRSTGLTDVQKEFLSMASDSYSDREMALKLGCAESTVRNTRFALRERARQARAFLAVMELAEEKMPSPAQPRLRTFPAKEGKRKELLPRFANLFEPGREYSEKDVKAIIQPVYDDDAIIRRYLVEYGYLRRSPDGRRYYKTSEETVMNKQDRKAIINSYKEREIEMGIIRIRCKATGYSFIDISNNLYKPFEGIKFQLGIGSFRSKKMQADWRSYGESGFEFDVVEKLKSKDGDSKRDKMDSLDAMLKKWIDGEGPDAKLYEKK